LSELDRETECLIGLGGNVGPVQQTIRTALLELGRRGCRVLDVSQFFKSAPMGPDAGQEFVNAAARIQTGLPPHALLSLLQQIENESGRRREIRWGPRTLDLDLLCYGQQRMSSDTLVIPHPGIWYRRFVLDPLLEIAADWQHVNLELSIRELRKRLDRRPLRIEVAAAKLPVCPEQYKGRILLEMLDAEAAAKPVAPSVFCRFVTDSVRPQALLSGANFTLVVGPEELDSMLTSVVDAALGDCEA